MSQIVQATCPGCQQVLRIPADWLGQAFKCKHCGMVIQARGKAPPPTAPTAVSAPKPIAPTAGPRPAKPSRPSSADPFSFEEDQAATTPPRRSRPRKGPGGGLAKGLILAGVVLGVAIVAAAFAWPHLSRMAAKPGEQVAERDGDGATDELSRDSRKAAPQRETTKKTDIPFKQDTGKKPAKPDRSTPPSDLPVASGPFPRRVLAISINNYLFANPINYGMPIASGANVQTLLEDKLTQAKALHVPGEQTALLSDMASERLAQPPTEDVIRNTIVNFLDTSRAQDRIILLIVGHVVEIEGEPVLLPIDGMTESKDGTIPLKWIYEKLEACKARQKVLILDTCRLDPSKGQERPGSGPMGANLDKMLKEPPAGVQVWSACVAEQFSYEFEGVKVNNGLFLQALNDVVFGISPKKIQEPADALPMERLVEAVNLRMKEDLPPGKEQTSRLAGSEAEGGAAYDSKEAMPPRMKVAPPAKRPGGTADVALVRAILKDISFPPLKVSKDQKALTAEALPPFPADTLKEYMQDGEATPLRAEVQKARELLAGIAANNLNDNYKTTGVAEGPLKAQVHKDQKTVAKVIGELMDQSDALKAVEEHRKSETKRWQASYDYLVARVDAQIAYLNEYQAVLGQILKGLAPPDPKLYQGWRLASQYDPQSGDSVAKKLGSESRKKLDKIIKAYPNTPWAIMARRDKASGLGLEWQPMK